MALFRPVDLHFEVVGEGPDLVILHGLFGSLDNWRGVARRLAPRFRVWLIDQRNHGRSPHHAMFDYPVMAEDLSHFLNRHALSRVYLLGHSMGGKAAMTFAARHPERVSRLIVEDMGPGAYRPRHEDIFRGLLDIPLVRLRNRSEADKRLRNAVPEDAVRGFLLKNLYRNKDGCWGWRCHLPALFANYRKLLAPLPLQAPISCPTLFVRGELSDYLEPSRPEPLLRLFVQRQSVTLPKAGHWVHADQPEAFLQTVEAFLSQG